ncbi:hypothetical protein K505DRAFT_363792 [Melanomma pulvis-pyrius CBS 109.77]|uniref:Uncharacterized protein n=1 Tax=Melanomma pulvis-pyrius CBS 109.77 TaxID=1314802 RepID=A0A6A6X5Q4_9PLEO|nr:hypothetical protein K505DRAFT_363792 [Melanomma pulvis-pyrius CBS 109.77]
MDSSESRGRQTTILNDAQALSLSTSTQKKAPRARNPPESATTKAAGPMRVEYYEQNGLKINLYEKVSKKRRAGARQVSTLVNKHGKDLLDIIQDYAGPSKRQEMATKLRKEQAEWISEVETLALGPPLETKRGKKATAQSAGQDLGGGDQENKNQAITTTIVNKPQPTANGYGVYMQPRQSSQEEHSTTRLPQGVLKNGATNPTGFAKGPILPATQRVPISLTTAIAEQASGSNINKASTISASSAIHKKTKKRPRDIDEHPDEESTQISRRLKKAKKSHREKMPDQNFTRSGMTSIQERERVSISPILESTEIPSCAPAKVNRASDKRHPLLDILNLDPSSASTSTTVCSLNDRKETAIITAVSEACVLQTFIPWVQPKPQERMVPFLKPGKHGWDYENHRWGFERDEDLHTGHGHQVEPADEARKNADPSFAREFRQKYPGVLGNQWPCGCQMPWNDEDSEEE